MFPDATHRPFPPGADAPAVVLACLGAPEGDLNAVRSLGEQGIRVIVVAEYEQPPSRHSRHCAQFLHVPDFSRHPQRLAKALLWLKAHTATSGAKLATLARAMMAGDAANDDEREALARMGYDAPAGFADRVSAKLVLLALRQAG